jgi:hypothetical protein
MRAFIFSLDAFVAFTLALLAIYSLIFFSSVPSSYYYLLTQGHYLSRDVLMALSTTVCDDDHYTCTNTKGTLLENIISEDDSALRENLIDQTVGEMIPDQFGYAVEMSQDEGGSWALLYDTASKALDDHAKIKKKLTVSSQVIAFDYSGDIKKLPVSPYNYLSCGKHLYGSAKDASDAGYINFGLLTCGEWEVLGLGGDTDSIARGNTHPSNLLGDELVPSSDATIVRLTVYI